MKTIFPLLAFLSPLRARKAPACLSRFDGMAGELHIQRQNKDYRNDLYLLFAKAKIII
jgi:hypothetical protein